MFDIFMYAINAVMPIIMLIVLGYILKQVGFLDANFVKRGNKLVFRVGLPALLFYTFTMSKTLAHLIGAPCGSP